LGALAHLVERNNGIVEVTGSIPVRSIPTILFIKIISHLLISTECVHLVEIKSKTLNAIQFRLSLGMLEAVLNVLGDAFYAMPSPQSDEHALWSL
jgi:hypothetical protein